MALLHETKYLSFRIGAAAVIVLKDISYIASVIRVRGISRVRRKGTLTVTTEAKLNFFYDNKGHL